MIGKFKGFVWIFLRFLWINLVSWYKCFYVWWIYLGWMSLFCFDSSRIRMDLLWYGCHGLLMFGHEYRTNLHLTFHLVELDWSLKVIMTSASRLSFQFILVRQGKGCLNQVLSFKYLNCQCFLVIKVFMFVVLNFIGQLKYYCCSWERDIIKD